MLLFQDGSTHRWVAALRRDLDLIVTLDDAMGKSIPDGSLAIFDGPRCLARFHQQGRANDAVFQVA